MKDSEGEAKAASTNAPTFTSKLETARERFLAAIVEHALSIGRRKPTDFLRAFGAREIMAALRDQPVLRANILAATTGLNAKVAIKKSAESAGDDLEIALTEKVTTEEAIVTLFDPDDRVRYLDHARLWEFVVQGDFWKARGAAAKLAREHMAYILARARAEKLLSDRDLVDGIGLETLVASLPKPDVVRLLERALTEGRATRPLTDEGVLDVLPPAHLLEHVDLTHVWERVIAAKLAASKPGLAAALAPAPVAAEEPTTNINGAVLPEKVEAAGGDAVPVSVASVDVNIEDGEMESVVIEDDDMGDADSEVTANLEIDAMLSRVGPSEVPR
jgi:hypothetical protein